MGQRVEIPSGVIDGLNATFSSSVPYQLGSLSVWRNGQQVPPDGISYTDPSSGIFTISDPDCIPISGPWGSDTIAIDYNDTSTDPEIVEVDDIACSVDDGEDAIRGEISDNDAVYAHVDDAPSDLQCYISDYDAIYAQVDDVGDVIGVTVEDCC